MNTSRLLITACIGLSALRAQAQSASAPAGPTQHAAASAMADGEVRKVDKEAGKLTLRHGPLTNLDMAAMTMVFRVADAKMLDAVKQGDKVRFAAEKVNGQFTVTQIELVR
jgi:Cu/Ag efflux protein CusF